MRRRPRRSPRFGDLDGLPKGGIPDPPGQEDYAFHLVGERADLKEEVPGTVESLHPHPVPRGKLGGRGGGAYWEAKLRKDFRTVQRSLESIHSFRTSVPVVHLMDEDQRQRLAIEHAMWIVTSVDDVRPDPMCVVCQWARDLSVFSGLSVDVPRMTRWQW